MLIRQRQEYLECANLPDAIKRLDLRLYDTSFFAAIVTLLYLAFCGVANNREIILRSADCGAK
jgi:hypothetical protein